MARAGLEPALCDVEVETLDYQFEQLEALVAETRPLAVVSSHLFGLVADIGRTKTLCRRHGAFVIDDAAQAFGCRTASGNLGTLGDVGLFSFGRGKTVTSVHGGMILTASDDIARENQS